VFLFGELADRRDDDHRLEHVAEGRVVGTLRRRREAEVNRVGVALEDGAEIIACLHDDVAIYEYGWDQAVLDHFARHPKCGLLGFGGGTGLGAANIYQTPYDPMQLARQDFVSNMKDAEVHGRRVQVPMRVACLDGFSQVGRREFWQGKRQDKAARRLDAFETPLFQQMQSWGVVHHFYDGMLGCFAARLGWDVWMLPIACHHLGGQTAVGDKGYQDWANAHPIVRDRRGHMAGGDLGFWLKAHEIGYDQFRDVLPIRVEQP
jgi:hypothetical protein